MNPGWVGPARTAHVSSCNSKLDSWFENSRFGPFKYVIYVRELRVKQAYSDVSCDKADDANQLSFGEAFGQVVCFFVLFYSILFVSGVVYANMCDYGDD